ncbi:MAG: divergent polysaccharide deacetylase family protein [Desulfovibrionales bacterium]
MGESPKARPKKKRPRKKNGTKVPGPGRSLLLWAGAVVLTFACLVLVLKLPSIQPEPEQRAAREVSEKNLSSGSPGPSLTTYEEFPSQDLEQTSREIDLILLQTLVSRGVKPEHLKHKDVALRRDGHQTYHYQTLVIHSPVKEQPFVDHLKSTLEQWSPDSSLVRCDSGKREWEVVVSGHPTHKIIFDGIVPTPPVPQGRQGRLVIVIDDLGESLRDARALAALDLPIAFSILPNSTRTNQVVELARATNKDILLHLPMEPAGYPETANPGTDALFVHMPDEDILAVLAENLARIPDAIGVNNHMGSRFTEDPRCMHLVLNELRNRNLFFLDSLTSPRTASPRIARDLGLSFLKRDIFLDNVQDVDLIIYQLQKAEKLALRHGSAVAIGHPYPETIIALKRWATMRNDALVVTSIRDLVGARMVAKTQP